MAERRWEGGRVRRDSRGRDAYVIRRQVNGRRYEVSTRAHSLRAALEQLKRFEAGPEGYDPRGRVDAAPIYLDEALAAEFLRWSREAKKNSVGWVADQRAALSWWADRLRKTNLRGASLDDDIKPHLARAPGWATKARVLKTLYTWLRTEREGDSSRRLKLSEDPTAGGMLKLPQAQGSAEPVAIAWPSVERVRKHLLGTYRDAFTLQMESGWHVTEVERFAVGGQIAEPNEPQWAKGMCAVLTVLHKSGSVHRTGVSEATAEAARRLRQRGAFSPREYYKAVASACRVAKVKPFAPGVLRHSVATRMVEAGVALPEVSTFLGHKSMQTTKKFYARFAVPENPLLIPPPAAVAPAKRSRRPT
jgi:integrase